MAKRKRVTTSRVPGRGADPVRVERVQNLRRSNAAGVHAHRSARGAQRRAAIREFSD